MVFKGGTSLSKVFGAIRRFSEDVDITIDHRDLAAELDPFLPGLSGSQRRRITDALRGRVQTHTTNVVKPYFERLLHDEFGSEAIVKLSDNGEQMHIPYETVVEPGSGYLREATVFLEFGGRNITEPRKSALIRPYLLDVAPALEFPEAKVEVLTAERTFWEKATLAHAACCRGKTTGDHAARHWYDLAALAKHDIARSALADASLLEDVVRYKRVFFAGEYDGCSTGGIRLVPDEPLLSVLRRDYEMMIAEGLLYGAPSTFDDIMADVTELERDINSRYKTKQPLAEEAATPTDVG